LQELTVSEDKKYADGGADTPQDTFLKVRKCGLFFLTADFDPILTPISHRSDIRQTQ